MFQRDESDSAEVVQADLMQLAHQSIGKFWAQSTDPFL